MTDERDIPEDDFGGDDMVAAEFSLGLLSYDVQAQMARRVRIDPKFASLVEDWDMRFSPLAEAIAPVAPPKGLFKKITNDAYSDSAKGLWRQLGVWPALLSAGAAALVLILAIQFGGLTQLGGPTATLAARIAAQDSSIVVAAAYIEDSSSLLVEWEVGVRLPDRDVELWLIAGEDAPVSLGVLNKGTKLTEFAISADLQRRLEGAVLAVSDEPFGGSPTGVPTGAVLAVGQIIVL